MLILAVLTPARFGRPCPASARFSHVRLHSRHGLRVAAGVEYSSGGTIIDFEANSGSESSRPSDSDSIELARLKAKLLSAVAGTDRGVAASPLDQDTIENCASALESAASFLPGPTSTIDERLSGKWRLVYSSTFAGKPGGSQGFEGSPTGGGPLRLGAVFQRIQARKKRCDNIVEVSLPAPLPFLPALRASACLSHALALVDGRPLSVRITFDKLILRPRGVRGARALELPSPLSLLSGGVQLPEEVRGGGFETGFVDEELRVSRGDRGELRVFVKV